jgi:hypothetical protein
MDAGPAARLADDAALAYLLAGKATVTLRHVQTGTRYTYTVTAVTTSSPTTTTPTTHVVRLVDPRSRLAEEVGHIVGGRDFMARRPPEGTEADRPARAFAFVLRRLVAGETLPDGVEVWHEGTCGRCGKPLVVPESIDRGIGPRCAKGKSAGPGWPGMRLRVPSGGPRRIWRPLPYCEDV